MGMIPETLLVPMDPGNFNWRATAIRLCDGDPWHVFVACDEDNRHLSPLETLHRPGAFHIQGEESLLAKLVFLFGRSWSEILDDPTEVIGAQARSLEAMSDEFVDSIRATHVEDIREWVAGEGPLSEGELLRAMVTKDDVLCLRN